MAAASPAAVRKQIAAGRTDPLYLILGEDEEEKSRLVTQFAELVEEDLRPFNIERLYGDETTLGAVMESARTLPVLAPRRVVTVLRAECLLMPKRESLQATRDLDAFDAFIKAPEPHATVVLAAGPLDRRRRIVAALLKRATVVEFEGLDGARDADRWVRTELKRQGVTMDADARGLLIARAGPDIVRLRADLKRVVLYARGQPTVHRSDVDMVVGPAASQDDWAIARAIERGAADVALRELALVFEAGAVPVMILGQLGYVARTKFPAPRVPAAIEALYRTDLALKTSGGDPRVLLERLVVDLCRMPGS